MHMYLLVKLHCFSGSPFHFGEGAGLNTCPPTYAVSCDPTLWIGHAHRLKRGGSFQGLTNAGTVTTIDAGFVAGVGSRRWIGIAC